mmetsp:Transcript_15922/g.24589  ORF Transcript_15922/g.24589 Transcript_15922/m.24589 type:complete len:132 (+) Transcript_15922:3-398(+)
MSELLKARNEHRDNQSLMILTMENKLKNNEFALFRSKFKKDPKICGLSTDQYWNLLYYIDDDYLTDYEIIRMKELYRHQLQELSGQFVAHFAFGWAAAVAISGRLFKGHFYSWWYRFPMAVSLGGFLSIQA